MDNLNTNLEENKLLYARAVKHVKNVKGFYTHLTVYILINLFLVYINTKNLESGESYFQLKNFFTAFFWGIGLLSHGLSVFGPRLFLTKNWEQKKIKEFMDKDKNQY